MSTSTSRKEEKKPVKPSAINKLTKQLKDLKLEQASLLEKVSEEESVKESIRKIVKLPIPVRYTGSPTKLNAQVLQIRNFITYYKSRFEDEESKTIYAGALLDDVAAKWYKPYAKRHLEYKDLTATDNETLACIQREWSKKYPETYTIFDVFENFTQAITVEFGELDAERRAEEQLLALK